MLVYNITFQVDFNDARNFVIWIHQAYIPRALEGAILHNARLCKILSHHDEDSECFSLQFEVEDSAALHKWYKQYGVALHEEMLKIFDQKVIAFTTLMEVIDEA